MTVLTCGVHDPKAGLEWLSDKYSKKLLSMFDHVVISASPLTDKAYLQKLSDQGYIIHRRRKNHITTSYLEAIKQAVALNPDTILYCDFDRVMHWVHTHAKELSCVAKHIEPTGYFIGMRGPKEYATHHDALRYTEELPNAIISDFMGESSRKDYLSGCYGFSYAAAEFIIKNISFKSWATFGEWPLIMKKNGYPPTYAVCKGLAWENADQHQEEVKRAGSVAAYREQLSNPAEWQKRSTMALEFVSSLILKP
jgi:hypothetical protein